MSGLEKVRRNMKPWKNHLLNFRHKGKASETFYSKKYLKRSNARKIRHNPVIDEIEEKIWEEVFLDTPDYFIPQRREPFRFLLIFL